MVAAMDDNGVIVGQEKFPTPGSYDAFKQQLIASLQSLSENDFRAVGVGIPGKIDRDRGVGLDFGHLKWHNVPVQSDCEKIFACPAVVENDANLGGLSEAMLLPQYKKVLYVTVSTGIGIGLIDSGEIDPGLADGEGGHMLIEHGGKLEAWENFASGRALVAKYGKRAEELIDQSSWKQFAHDLSRGFIELIAVIEPDVIVVGGSVGHYFDRYQDFLVSYLKKYETPLITIPPFQKAARPDEAVVYGCYDIAKRLYGTR